MKHLFFAIFLVLNYCCTAQIKILFDATKAQSAGNADWVIDANTYNISYTSGNPTTGGSEANPSRYPSPAQSGISASTTETFWKGGLSAWGVESAQAGYQVETLPIGASITYGSSANSQDLDNYDVLVIVEPNILFTASEKTAILQFVFNGGGLIIVGNHDGSDRNNDGFDSIQVWNDLMSNNSVQTNPFGFSFDATSFSQTTSNIMINATSDPVMNGSFGSVTQMEYAAGTSMTMNPTANPNVKALIYKTGVTKNNNNIMALRSQFGLGRIVAIGDSSPVDDGTGDTGDSLFDGWFTDASGNHRKLMMNATAWAVQGSVLPIELASFQGKIKKESNHLSCYFADNEGLNLIEVEKSSANNKFEKIGEIRVSAKQFTYEFEDKNPGFANYYRLKMIENDGHFSYSKIVYLERNQKEKLLHFSSNQLNINPLKEQSVIAIFDIAGKKIFEQTLLQSTENQVMELENMPFLQIIVLKNEKGEILDQLKIGN